MRLVLDTDVVFSGLRSLAGASRVLLQAVEAGAVIPLISVATFIEYEAVIKRAANLEAAGLSIDDADRFLDGLAACAEHITPYFQARPLVRDPDDNMFAELAVNAAADAIVTFNIADYSPPSPRFTGFSIPVCRPGDILRRLAWRPPVTSRSASLRP